MAEGRAASSTRVPLIVAIVLVLVLGIGGVLAGSKKKSSKRGAAPAGTRAVIVPAGSRPLTFVIPPCGTGRVIRPADADKQRKVKGAAVFQLPARASLRTVQVPACGTQAGTPPAAAFVLQGTRGGGKAGTQLQLELPTGGLPTTIVVPRCSGKRGRGAAVLPPPAAGSKTALAPRC
jgi:hypothetical protein